MAYYYEPNGSPQLQVNLGDGVWISCGVDDLAEARRICHRCGWTLKNV